MKDRGSFHTGKSTSSSTGRRRFLRHVTIMALGAQLPWLSACKREKVLNTGGVLTSSQAVIADYAFDLLLPADGHGPSAKDVRAYPYFLWVLQDPEYDPEQQEYYKEGLDRIEERANETYGVPFHTLSIKKRKPLFQTFAQTDWGESWMSSMLTVTIEALLGDPIYGCNPGGISWKWLSHFEGQPRPGEHNQYPNILERKKETYAINKFEQL